MKIFMFFGASGSGKSTLPLHICSHEKTELIQFPSETDPNKAKFRLTEVPARKLVLLGKYSNACGGADTICRPIDGKNTADLVFEAIYTAIDRYKDKDYNILAEGMLFGAFALHRFEELQEYGKKNGIEIITVFFTATVEECYQRIMIRNGNKPVNVKNIEQKHATVQSRIKQWNERGYKSYKIDNKGSKEELIERLTKLIES